MDDIGTMITLLISVFFLLATLPGTIELIFLTIGALLPRRKLRSHSSLHGKLVVIIPAHNEEVSIGGAIESLRDSDQPVDIVVIADNCSDKTASIASDKGARVIERNDTINRGKPYALNFALDILEEEEDYDWYVFIDADSRVENNFIPQVRQAFIHGSDAVQTRYGVLHPHTSLRRRLMHIAFLAFNTLRPLGRSRWGLSCGISGNGFGVTREVVKKVPIPVSSVVEDLSYHLQLIEAGYKVHFIPTTSVLGEIPSSGKGVSTQRVRWEGGRFMVLGKHLPGLIKGIVNGKYEWIEPALDLLLLPLAYHTLILLLLPLSSSLLVLSYAALGLTVVGFHLAAAIYLGGGGYKDAASLLLAPFYMLWKLGIFFKTLLAMRKGLQWEKTARNSPQSPPSSQRENQKEKTNPDD